MIRPATVLLATLLPLATGFADHKQPPTARPYAVVDADYPLHLQILVAAHRYHYRGGNLDSVSQTGVGNLLSDQPVGFQYKAACHDGFHHSETNEFYQARWKKPGEKIELLMMYVGKKKPDTCIIDITTRAQPYTLDDVKDQADDDSS